MEQVREENSTDEEACRWKDSDPPFKTDAHNVYTESRESSQFNRGSEPPSSSYRLQNTTRIMVEELTTKTHIIPDKLMNINVSGKGKLPHPRQEKWPHLYKLAGGWKSNTQHGGSGSGSSLRGNDQMMLCAREDLKRKPCDFRDLNTLSSLRTKQNPEEISAHLSDGYNKIISNNTLHFGDSETKALPKSCFFPQFSVRKPLECKGNSCISNQEAASMCQKDETVAETNKVASEDTLLDSSAKNDHYEPSYCEISLRDRLTPGCCRLSKVESMRIFKKIVELVDFAHCQGVVLQDIRPSSFILLPFDRVKYTGPLPQMEIQDVMKHKAQINYSYENSVIEASQQQYNLVNVQLEKKWYASPECLNEKICTFAANIYSLGVLLFEMLCCSKSWDMHSAMMMDLQRRIFPPNLLLESPIEAGFCLWLLHPDPSSRPTAREILQSEVLCDAQELNAGKYLLPSDDNEDDNSEMLLHFLTTMQERKLKHASKLKKELSCLKEDIKEVKRRNSLRTSLDASYFASEMKDEKLVKLENIYFSMRSETQNTDDNAEIRSDTDLLKNREKIYHVENENAMPCVKQEPPDRLGSFFESVCKFACYTKLKVCGTLRNGDLLNSSNVICSLSVDRDDDYIAAAGVSKKIKIFDCSALLNEGIDVNYPVVEMSNKSKLSCVCWNNYIKNYLASTDYDGVVQMWDASTGQELSAYSEHQKRAWSVDFSQVDPTKFASGSDDCSVKLWSIKEKNSTSSILNQANVCCVQYSAYSSHLLAFGSADYKIYCYDLRHTRIPWCTLAGHVKTVSYVRFVDSDTLVSASTDNTLKLWDLNKTSLSGLSSEACSITFKGHTNEKNFVGLSSFDGYIACGSESNEVFTYYKSLPMPITSHKFRSVDPISGHEITGDNNAQFVSSVCWRRKSNMIVAANSTGTIDILQLVKLEKNQTCQLSLSFSASATRSLAKKELTHHSSPHTKMCREERRSS